MQKWAIRRQDTMTHWILVKREEQSIKVTGESNLGDCHMVMKLYSPRKKINFLDIQVLLKI